MTPQIYTYTGRLLNPLAVGAADLAAEDLAHHLALCNRFAGATREPVSVAQHSWWAAELCRQRGAGRTIQLQALLHDASEAYLGDVTKWLKGSPEMAAYRAAEARLQRLIYARYGCPEEDDPLVKWADTLLVRYEMLRALPAGCHVGAAQPSRRADYPPLTPLEHDLFLVGDDGRGWYFWSWQLAEYKFLERFTELTTTGPADAPENKKRQHGFQGARDGDPHGYDPDQAVV